MLFLGRHADTFRRPGNGFDVAIGIVIAIFDANGAAAVATGLVESRRLEPFATTFTSTIRTPVSMTHGQARQAAKERWDALVVFHS
jgi:hypothetical protein